MGGFRVATLSLLLARIIYTINWFNIASIFYLIALVFSGLFPVFPFVAPSFLFPLALFQVPAGIIAAKYGLRNMAIYGIMIASTAALVTGLASGTMQITILRFLVGVGMACFFGPSVMLVSRYLGKES
ncbi:MAG: hypothetical protein QOK79_11035, partial [Nitrososphaeraceae archaeon]|nr:hypothetical protein [Nitrososphaeraceae archaeon]